MARVTAAEVKQILDPNVTITDVNADAFITGANTLLNEIYETDTTMTAAAKKEVERWLSAHMIVIAVERMPAIAGGGPAPSVTFVGQTGLGLEQTSYGQTAMMLDTTGLLAARSNTMAAEIYVVPQTD